MKKGALYRVVQKGLDTGWSLYSDQKKVRVSHMEACVLHAKGRARPEGKSRAVLGISHVSLCPAFLHKFLGTRLKSTGIHGKYFIH